MTFTDRNGVAWTVRRDLANPRWWVAAHPDGWLAHGVDAPTRRDALDQLKALDRSNVL